MLELVDTNNIDQIPKHHILPILTAMDEKGIVEA
jgi:hypothetical protein